MTDPQVRYCVEFWSGRLRPKVSDENLLRFERALTKRLMDDRSIRAVCCYFGPHFPLSTVLNEVGLHREPPVLIDDVDLVANPDGSIDQRVGEVWQKVKPED